MLSGRLAAMELAHSAQGDHSAHGRPVALRAKLTAPLRVRDAAVVKAPPDARPALRLSVTGDLLMSRSSNRDRSLAARAAGPVDNVTLRSRSAHPIEEQQN